MFKPAILTLLAGLTTAMTLAPSAAQFAVPGGPNNPQPSPSVETHCWEQMGHMRRVNQDDISSIRGQSVYLIPICEDATVFGKNNYGPLFINGNVERLREPIRRNGTLMAALAERGYDQHDVVSLRFGGNDSIILYVHQRDMN